MILKAELTLSIKRLKAGRIALNVKARSKAHLMH